MHAGTSFSEECKNWIFFPLSKLDPSVPDLDFKWHAWNNKRLKDPFRTCRVIVVQQRYIGHRRRSRPWAGTLSCCIRVEGVLPQPPRGRSGNAPALSEWNMAGLSHGFQSEGLSISTPLLVSSDSYHPEQFLSLLIFTNFFIILRLKRAHQEEAAMLEFGGRSKIQPSKSPGLFSTFI